MLIGEKIEVVVRNAGRPVEDIAKDIGMSGVNLYRLFKRESVETKHLEKLSTVLQVPIRYFFEETWDQVFTLNYDKTTSRLASKELNPPSDLDFWKEQIRIKDQLLLDAQKRETEERERTKEERERTKEERERTKRCQEELERLKNGRSSVYEGKLTP